MIAFPDDGAHKRFGKMFQSYPNVICIKVREGDKRIVTIKEGQEYVKDAHVFIIDDLVKTGNTSYNIDLMLNRRHSTRNKGQITVSWSS